MKNNNKMNNSIAAVILTKNEEKHIVRCLESLKGVCDDIVVVDCFSEDRTEELATVHGARVIKHPWKNYATQFNYGVYECGITADWIWRIDADEFLEGGEVRQCSAICLCIQRPFVEERRVYAA